MDHNAVIHSWFRHVLNGDKPKMGGAYHYQGNILFLNNWPQARLEENGVGEWILLAHRYYHQAQTPKTFDTDKRGNRINVQDVYAADYVNPVPVKMWNLGVHSHLANHYVSSGSDLDVFMLEQFKLERMDVVAEAHNLYTAAFTATGGTRPLDAIRQKAKLADEARIGYCNHFLITTPQTQMCMVEVENVFNTRARVHNAPELVAKREEQAKRRRAKQLALEVLGVE